MGVLEDVREGDGPDTALDSRLRRIHVIAVAAAAVWFVATAACTLWGSDRILSGHLEKTAVSAERDAKAISGVVDRIFYELAAIPQVMANSRELQRLVARYNARGQAFAGLSPDERSKELKGDPVIARITERLTLIRNKLNYDLISILDTHGIRIAVSDWDRPVSLLGERLDDREYFAEAKAGTAGQMFAVARTTGNPVFFFSAPMEDEGKVIGVVVARQDSAAVGSMLAGTEHVTLLIDAAGMVLAASKPGFALRHVGTMADARPDAQALQNVYAQEKLVALAVEPPSHRLHEAEWLIDGHHHLLVRARLTATDHSLLILTPIDWLERERRLHYLIGALAVLFGVLTVLLVERRAASRAREQHDSQVTAALNRKLTALNAEKDRYLGIAAHDLRNPLSSMRGLSELMVETPLEPEQQKEFLETIHRTSDEMLTLVNDLLDVSVIESGKLDLRRADQDAAKLVRQRVRHLEPHARGKKMELKLDVVGEQRASIDGARFSQVIDNLVSNAIKFSPPGTAVEVSLRSRDGSFVLSVQDQGPGIPEEERKLLFRSFQKLSARPTGGEKSTGLGLAIVKKIVDAHGGTIEVDSAPGSGTRFTVAVPSTSQGG